MGHVFLRRRGAALTPPGRRVWKKYEALSAVTYFWDQYDRGSSSTTRYYWDRFNLTTAGYALSLGTQKDIGFLQSYPFTFASGFDTTTGQFTGTVTKYSNDTSIVGMYCTNPTAYRGYVASFIERGAQEEGGSNYYYHYYVRPYTITSSAGGQKGTAAGSVSSTSRSAYPDDAASGSYWYVYDRSNTTTSYYQGSTHYGEVSSASRGAYPDNSYSGSYWYVYDREETSWSMGTYVEDVEDSDVNAYPENGRHTDGYWYVLQA